MSKSSEADSRYGKDGCTARLLHGVMRKPFPNWIFETLQISIFNCWSHAPGDTAAPPRDSQGSRVVQAKVDQKPVTWCSLNEPQMPWPALKNDSVLEKAWWSKWEVATENGNIPLASTINQVAYLVHGIVIEDAYLHVICSAHHPSFSCHKLGCPDWKLCDLKRFDQTLQHRFLDISDPSPTGYCDAKHGAWIPSLSARDLIPYCYALRRWMFPQFFRMIVETCCS